jgi:hypothetical protein
MIDMIVSLQTHNTGLLAHQGKWCKRKIGLGNNPNLTASKANYL